MRWFINSILIFAVWGLEAAVFEKDLDKKKNFIIARPQSIDRNKKNTFDFPEDDDFYSYYNGEFDLRQSKEEDSRRKKTRDHPIDHEKSGNISLAFVFDATQTMVSELMDLRRAIHEILASLEKRSAAPIGHFIWTLFNDSAINSASVTTDPHTFKKEIINTALDRYVNGTGLCFKYPLGALKKTLELALPGSHVYVFTDALPRDSFLFNETISIILNKKIKVSVVKTKGCGLEKPSYLSIYNYLTDLTSGLMFLAAKNDFYKVLYYISEGLKTESVTLASINKPGTQSRVPRKFHINVDNSLTNLTFCLASEKRVINVYDARGIRITHDRTKLLLDLPNLKAMRILSPEPGRWTVKVNASSSISFRLRITGSSSENFEFGFTSTETASNPVVYVDATPPDSKSVLSKLCNINLHGKRLKCFDLVNDRRQKNRYLAPSFAPTSHYPFFFEVYGFNGNGEPMQRLTSTVIMSVFTDKPTIEMEEQQSVSVGKNANIACKIKSRLSVVVHWFKNGRLFDRKKIKCSVQCTANYFIQNVTKESEAYYTCEVENTVGTGSKSQYLHVEPHESPVLNSLNSANCKSISSV